jgi:chemotaxis protein MotA
MDIATIIGILSGLALIFGAIITQGSLQVFVSVPSMMVVLGGTLAATLITFPLRDVYHAFQAAKQVFTQKKTQPSDVVAVILQIAEISRRQGLLALSRIKTDNAILKKALMLISDGAPDDLIENTLRIEIDALKTRHGTAQDVFRKMGAYSPAFGMLGTLIGLVQMLSKLEDTASIGPAMALALITTFYGSLMASLIFLPVAGKLKSRTANEVLNLEIIFQGARCILESNNPLLIYEKLNSFVPPGLRREFTRGQPRPAEKETNGAKPRQS